MKSVKKLKRRVVPKKNLEPHVVPFDVESIAEKSKVERFLGYFREGLSRGAFYSTDTGMGSYYDFSNISNDFDIAKKVVVGKE